MFDRIIRYIKGLFGMKLDEWEDPEVLLAQAQQEMQTTHAKNRERAIQAITQKNNLQKQVEDTQKTVDNLQASAEKALKTGDRDLARQLLVEKQQYEGTLVTSQASLQSALESVEAVKVAIRREEEQIRSKTAQALALKAQWKQSQIEISLNKALDGITSAGTDEAFQRASAKIASSHSESMARSEIAKESLSGRIASVEDASAQANADEELTRMEQKLGLTSASPASAAPATATDIDKQLQELEQKVGRPNTP